MTQFSANLGFLWTDRPLPDAIRAAKAAGFHAVECHWPYDVPTADINAALDQTGLAMLGLNTRRGDVTAGDNGLTALCGREDEARAAITEAIEYGSAIGARSVHVMAGNTTGAQAHKVFVQNLHFATKAAQLKGMQILIEPLNRFDAPDYFLRNTDQARRIIEDVAAPNLKMMFDCYHVGRTEGDVIGALKNLLPLIGHIQFASVPDRGTPDHGAVDYRAVFAALRTMGWEKPLGAEYRPNGDTDATLAWLKTMG